MPCDTLVREFQAVWPAVRVMVVTGPGVLTRTGAHYYLDSYDPARIPTLLQQLKPK